MKKKKIIIGTVVLLFLMCLVPIEHYYGDNIYGALMYGEYDVKKISDSTYHVSKDRPVEAFNEYMESQGYEFVDQMGAGVFYGNESCKKMFDFDFKEFYAEFELVSTETIEENEFEWIM